jgi:hypothetical protein
VFKHLLKVVDHLLILIVPYHLVLVKFAAGRFLTRLATAPPHLARPLGLVRTTRPVEVVGVFVVTPAVLAHFRLTAVVIAPLPQLESRDLAQHLLPFIQ